MADAGIEPGVKRVVDTTGGRIEIEYWDGEFGELTVFDADGWETGHAEWDDDLAEQLTSIAGLPDAEAAVVANDILTGYRMRPRERDETSLLGTFVGVVAVLAMLATMVIGAATIVRFVLDRV